MLAKVYVSYKDAVLDPQGKTVKNALQTMGFTSISDVRQGKYFVIRMEDMPKNEAEKLLREIADKVLSNPVIEKFEIVVDKE